MPAKIKVPFTKERLQTEYQTKAVDKIAIKYGVSKKYVLLRMKEFGIPRRQRIPPVDQIKKLGEDGLSAPEIGRILGFTSTYIRMIAKKENLFIKDKFHRGYIDQHGYMKVKKPDHPFADAKGYVGLHRLVLEEKLRRFLEPHELPHHKDGNKMNNVPDNLELSNKAEHPWKFHRDEIMNGRKSKKPRTRGNFSSTDTLPDR